jgi:hypothetical protein
MTWLLGIQTKSSGEHEIQLGEDEAEAKAALERAQEEWASRRRATGRGAAHL